MNGRARIQRGNFFSNLSITNKIIAANVFFYLISIFVLLQFGEKFFLDNFALTPQFIFQGKSVWTLLTSMFSHVLFFHIFANMFSLFFIGNFLERIIGKKRLVLLYLLSGLMGGIFFASSGIIFGDNSPGVGASGAIFGLLGVLAVLVPYSKIYLIVGPLLLILINVVATPYLPAAFASAFGLLLNVLIFVMIFAMFSFNSGMRKFAIPLELSMWMLPIVAIVPLVIIGFFVPLPIGNSAHIGGLVLGLAYGLYLRNKFPRKTKMLSQHFR